MDRVKDELEVVAKLIFVTMILILLIYIIILNGSDENLIDKIDEICTVLNLSDETDKICNKED